LHGVSTMQGKGALGQSSSYKRKTEMEALQNLHSDISSGRTLSMRPFVFPIIAVLS